MLEALGTADLEHARTTDAPSPALKAAGLYSPLAIEWRRGVLKLVSLQLAAKQLGAREEGVAIMAGLRDCCQGEHGGTRALWRMAG